MIWELAVLDGEVLGAWGLDLGSGDYVYISARAVVLSTGGAGAAYSRTDNPLHTTGDGYALAYRAGLPLADMEFVQFYPLSNADPAFPNRAIHPMAADVGRIINKNGEELVSKFGINVRPLAIQARDLLSRAICIEVAGGCGVAGGVMLDLTGAGENDWKEGDKLFGEARGSRVKEFLEKHFHIQQKPLLILPTCHFFMGGIPTDKEGRTGIYGLLAAGEIAAGLHGANRLGGNALTETVVFGESAGVYAARVAKDKIARQQFLPSVDINSRIKDMLSVLSGGSGGTESPADLRNRLRRLMWEKVGVLRNEKGLGEALQEIMFLAQGCRTVFDPGNPRQVVSAMEFRNLLLVAEAVAISALERTESRGSHYREDFPGKNDGEWERHLVVKKGESKMEIDSVVPGKLSTIKL